MSLVLDKIRLAEKRMFGPCRPVVEQAFTYNVQGLIARGIGNC